MSERMDISNRRTFLRTAGAVGVAAGLVGCGTQPHGTTPVKPDTSGTAEDTAVLQAALALEHQGIAAYEDLLLKGPSLDKETRATLGQFQKHHQAHRDALAATIRARSETPVAAKDSYDFKRPFDLEGWLRLAADTENKAANAYAEAIGKFSNRTLAVQAAKILAAEAWHTAALRRMLKEDPAPDWQLTS